MNISSSDMAAKSETLNSNLILRLYKQNMMLKFLEVKSKERKLTQKQKSNQLGYSDGTIKRYRDDIKMDILYKGTNYKKRPSKSIKTPIENSKSNKKSKNNILKGGNSNHGAILIEQAIANSVNE